MITTTLNRIRAHQPCTDGWGKLLKNLGKTEADDEMLPFAAILESNGSADALWCCRVEPQYAREWRLYAVWCARQVQHLTTDQRSLNAIDVAERYADGLATDDELETARAAAWDVAWGSGIDATSDAARAAAWAVAPDAAMNAAWYAAWEGASDAARAAQSREFLRVVTETGASVIDSYAEK